ncbi:hypothetical protein P0L94_16430 [Microbacter sp. GSS18]|nr:hypothetical protein P0L94_16430 [Microbacter sp. GSS18]
MAGTRITVSVDDEHVDDVDAVVARLEACGMTVEKVLPSLGMVTGTIEDPGALRDVVGIHPPVAERSVRLPPPGDDIQ